MITIILIALCAYSMPAKGDFGFQNAAILCLSAFACVWSLRDAWKVPSGQLCYAQGSWQWRYADTQQVGTLRLHVDLQNYMLVSFKAERSDKPSFLTTTQWFHLEANSHHQAAAPHLSGGAWLALRRAVLASPAHTEALAHAERVA